MKKGRSLLPNVIFVVLALIVMIGVSGVEQGAAERYDGTTVKVIVNAEYCKYAMSLMEEGLMEKYGIKLETEVIPGEAFVTKTLLEFNNGRSPWDLVMFNPDDFADYHRHFEPLEPYIKKLNMNLYLDDIAQEY